MDPVFAAFIFNTSDGNMDRYFFDYRGLLRATAVQRRADRVNHGNFDMGRNRIMDVDHLATVYLDGRDFISHTTV